MVYQYIAYNERGQLVRGKVPANTEQMATELLGYAGYRAVSLKPYVPFFDLDKLFAGMSRVRPAEVILFYRQLAMLLESGTDIAASLELLEEQATGRTLKKILHEVTSSVRSGNQLSAVLRKYSKIFSPTYCRLLSVGEESGDLEGVLKQIADYMESEATTAKETKSALTLPTITIVIAVAVVGLLIAFVLPTFGDLYGQLGVKLPTLARLLINFGKIIKANGMYILLAILAIVGIMDLYFRTASGRYRLDQAMLKMPLLGRVRHITELAHCCRAMALLVRSGLPLTEVMPLLVQSSGNRVIAKALGDVQEDMIKGEGLSRPMTKNKLFLPLMVKMIRVGEETGSLDVTLQAVARSYEAEAQDRMRSLVGLIQPVMTVVIGLAIGLVAVTLMTTMYGIYGQAF